MYYYYIIDDNIRNRAYFLSLKYKNNTQLQNWLQAEKEFINEIKSNKEHIFKISPLLDLDDIVYYNNIFLQ